MATPPPAPTYKYLHKLRGKRVLIFGGTSGIGFAVASACIEHDCTVILSGSNAPRLAQAVLRLRAAYPHISSDQLITHPCDLADKEHLDTNITTLLDVVTHGAKGPLDHVVFTAGDPRPPTLRLPDFTVAQLEAAQVVRGLAPAVVAKHLPRYTRASPDASYTLTSGFVAAKPPPGFGLLAASSVEGLARGLAVDLAPLRVNVVAPGVVRTEALANVPQQAMDALAAATTTKRLGRPEDLAEAYLYLMKDGYVTGSVLHSNGGRLLV